MFLSRTALTLLCAAGTLAAQAPLDLNSLAAAAKSYASHGLQGSQNPATLDLHLIRGESGGDPAWLMSKASDVQKWTLFYDTRYSATEGILLPMPRSASVKCVRGLFSDFLLSAPPIPACKSLENTWLAVNLEAAITNLNTHGYVRGFSQVETKRPDVPGVSDEPVYVFTCPWERTKVAISANTGAMTWYQMY